jgi:hypothetical protein
LTAASDTSNARKRPESSSPEKLKARNPKFDEKSKENIVKKGDDEDENYEQEEFDNLLDQNDDEEEGDEKHATMKVNSKQ